MMDAICFMELHFVLSKHYTSCGHRKPKGLNIAALWMDHKFRDGCPVHLEHDARAWVPEDLKRRRSSMHRSHIQLDDAAVVVARERNIL